MQPFSASVRSVRLLLLAAVGTSCGDNTAPRLVLGRPASLLIVAGDLQQDTVGHELATALVAHVVDSAGHRVPGQIVNFRVTAGGGSVFAGVSITDDSGQVRERWTLGPVAGDTQRVEARAVNTQTGAALVFGVFRAVGVPDVAAAITKIAGDGQSGASNQILAESLSVRVTDKFGNNIAGATVSWTVGAGSGTVSPQSTTTNTSGVARAQWKLGPTPGLQNASAAIVNGMPVTFAASSVPPSTPTVVSVVAGNDQTGAAGTALPESLSVRVTDQNGINMPGISVEWMVTFGGGSVSPTVSVTNTQGIAKSQWILGSTSGPDTATATVSSLPAVRFRATTFVPLAFNSLSSGGIYLDAHTCATTNSGETYCWGAGSFGRLGNTTTLSSATPVRVTGGHVFVTVTVGGYHSCGLTSDGQAFCWGRNNYGQLGNASTLDAAAPVAVAGAQTYRSLDAGAFHTCGLTTSGAGYCWGANFNGQLGDGSTNTRLEPTRVAQELTLTSISAGGNTEQSHTCALTNTGTAYCWGSGGFGQLGSTATFASSPVPVSSAANFVAITAGGYHSCGRATSGQVYCWGYNAYGQLGNGSTTTTSSTPVFAASLNDVQVGGWTSCGFDTDGAGRCWGWGHYGARGDGKGTDVQTTPTAISGGLTFRSLSPGSYHACGLTTTGDVYCWGYNADGQLGNGGNTDSSVPIRVIKP